MNMTHDAVRLLLSASVIGSLRVCRKQETKTFCYCKCCFSKVKHQQKWKTQITGYIKKKMLSISEMMTWTFSCSGVTENVHSSCDARSAHSRWNGTFYSPLCAFSSRVRKERNGSRSCATLYTVRRINSSHEPVNRRRWSLRIAAWSKISL